MKLIAQLQLKPTPEQAAALLATLETANEACDYLSGLAWDNQTFKRFDLHHLGYYSTRSLFSLTSTVVVSCVAKVAGAYKIDKATKRGFKKNGCISYNHHILSFKTQAQTVSIWTVNGRETIPFVCGDKQRALLANQKGECDLAFIKGHFYILACCEVEEEAPVETEGVLGVDLGIVEIATTSNGKSYSGEKVKALRRRHKSLRARLQKKGTKSAKRHLKKLSRKQANFVRNENHRISKEIVATAAKERKALALENLKGIR
ncbi:MAG: transposase, partial [Proteobacteria bacterium]